MGVWSALGFMALGGIVVMGFDWYAWFKYREGKREGMLWRNQNVGK